MEDEAFRGKMAGRGNPEFRHRPGLYSDHPAAGGQVRGCAGQWRLDKYERKKTEEIPYKYRDHAWLVGFAEKDGRHYVAVAMVEHGGHGGSDAGPVVGAVFDAILGPSEGE
jgi:penicillin-binding protein 2